MSAETLVAEAIEHARATTPKSGPYGDSQSLVLGNGNREIFVRKDVMDAALRHLAERATEAEAERATLVQALRRVRDEVTHARDHGSALYMLHKHTERALSAVGEDPRKGSGAYAEKGAPRG